MNIYNWIKMENENVKLKKCFGTSCAYVLWNDVLPELFPLYN